MSRGPGRPKNAPNNGNVFVRDQVVRIRATEGLNKTIEALVGAGYKSQADVIHEAVQLLAFKKLSKKADLYWTNRIQ